MLLFRKHVKEQRLAVTLGETIWHKVKGYATRISAVSRLLKFVMSVIVVTEFEILAGRGLTLAAGSFLVGFFRIFAWVRTSAVC